MSREDKSPGSSEESGTKNKIEEDEKPVDLASLQETIIAQNNLLLTLNKKLEALEKHQDDTDSAIITVAQKVGEGGGGGGGGSNLLTQLIPLLSARGPSALERIAMKSFLENMAFSTLTTRRLAKKQFGDEYTKMIKEMEGELSGVESK